MRKIGKHLTFANVVAMLALFVALGGASYAAFRLPRNSVGARQLKKGAVTAAKLNKGARAQLRGPTGPAGAVGIEGPRGSVGPQGPGATAVFFPLSEGGGFEKIGTYAGVTVEGDCASGSDGFELKPQGGTPTLDVYGTFSTSAGDRFPIEHKASKGEEIVTTLGTHEILLDVIARNTAVSPLFEEIRIHFAHAPGCVADGMVTHSSG